MQSSTHIDEQADKVSEASSDDDSINWGGNPKLRITAATLFAIGISPCFGVRAIQSLQVSLLLLDVLYIIPSMSFSDQTVNWVWGRQPVRFFAGGRVVWVLLALRGINWSQAFFIAFYQIVSQSTRRRGVYMLIRTRMIAFREHMSSLPRSTMFFITGHSSNTLTHHNAIWQWSLARYDFFVSLAESIRPDRLVSASVSQPIQCSLRAASC